MKRVRRLNLKKVAIFILILISIVVFAIVGIKKIIEDKKMKQTYEYKFAQIGYNENEIKRLKEKFNESELNALLLKEYNKNYINLIDNEYFDFNNLDKYVQYMEANMVEASKAIRIINLGVDKDWYSEIEQTDTSKGELMIVNKFNALSNDYVPELVLVSSSYAYANKYVSITLYEDLKALIDAAKASNFKLVVTQGYRSYKDQEETYNSYKSAYGTSDADEIAARPGHSEYQTGLSVDIEPYNKKVEDVTTSEEHQWLMNNSYKYGFILRYEKDTEYLTGFNYNPWRFRYVGKSAAGEIHTKGLTFDEYYNYYVNEG